MIWRNMNNPYGYKLEEELGEDYLIEFVRSKVAEYAPESSKIVAMNADEFLKAVNQYADTATSIEMSLDELNDMIDARFLSDDKEVVVCLAVPRVPSDEKEQLILTIVDSGQEALDMFATSLLKTDDLIAEVPVYEKFDIEEDFSDDELEGLAQKLDKMADFVANNPKEAYAIELAAHTIRELKG